VRQVLRDNLEKINPDKDWSFITSQIGMFSFTGLTPPQVRSSSHLHPVTTAVCSANAFSQCDHCWSLIWAAHAVDCIRKHALFGDAFSYSHQCLMDVMLSALWVSVLQGVMAWQ